MMPQVALNYNLIPKFPQPLNLLCYYPTLVPASLPFFSVTAEACFVKPPLYSRGLEEYESYSQILKDSKENTFS